MGHTLIIDSKLSGHHLEYLAHLWRICENETEGSFIFVVPRSFAEKREMIGLSDSKRIRIVYLTDREFASSNTGSLIKRAWSFSRIISKYSIGFSASKVFLVSIMDCLPFLPVLLCSKIQVSGIIYGIYLYTWKTSSLIKRVEDAIKYTIFARSRVFQTVFILNDAASARRLNALYNTSKFRFLVDPYLPISLDETISVRKEYGISEDKVLFVHFGSLGVRKGTMVILDSLELLSDNDIQKYAFVIAGLVPDTIKDDFYSRLETVKNKGVQIYVKDAFCDYSFLGKLCFECDAILAPYLDTARSSGIIGYSSQYYKPVIAPSSGLIGRLVKKYKLGYLLPSADSKCLCDAYRDFSKMHSYGLGDEYVISHDVCRFMDTVSTVL